MSASQISNFRTLKSLIRQLRSFGLSPRDWQIDRDSLTDYEISVIRVLHREDTEIQFQAELTRNKAGHVYLQQLVLMAM